MIKEYKNGVLISLLVQPKASKTEIAGLHGEEIKIRISAPPVDGAANQAVIEFFSRLFKVPKSQLSIYQGELSRHKVLFVPDITVATAQTLLLQKS